MKKSSIYIAVFVVSYLFFALLTMPAQFVLSQLQLPDNIEVSGVSGSIWQDNFQQIKTDKIVINKVETQLSFWSLFTLKPKVNIKMGDPLEQGPEGVLTVITDGKALTIKDADVFIAANELLKNANLALPIDAKGLFNIKLNNFTLGKPMCEILQGNVHWSKAKVIAWDQTVNLGSFDGVLACEQGALMLTINEENDLGLSYTAYMHQADKISGDGFIKPGEKFPENIKPLLSFIGKPDAEGRYRLSF